MENDWKRNKKLKETPGCLGEYDDLNGEFECGYDNAPICGDCKYGDGTIDPEIGE